MNRQENLFRNLSSPFTRLIRSFQMSRKTTSKTKARPNDNSFRSVTQTPQFRCRRKCMSLFRVEPYDEYRTVVLTWCYVFESQIVLETHKTVVHTYNNDLEVALGSVSSII